MESTVVGADVMEYIYNADKSERQRWVSDFIRIVDPWMPFIPLKELRTRLLDESRLFKGEDALLLACIKLNTEPLSGDQAVNKHYLAVKSTFVNAEVYGTLSIKLLQASLLLLLYEHGHGIYPSAYTTLGSCARYLGALDIGTGSEYDDTGDWMEGEQRRRLWWFIYVMERNLLDHGNADFGNDSKHNGPWVSAAPALIE
ncbi:fungal-specific transcription factor domain-containing protein [Penicillium angulare]|uniref:Fungal-specific transcription factor domain-containing protein n=1 Tax=Penicillium angulare TaxID=116970 RepID=A0A9W9FWF1_9EURO|nr:fungal-specific transcription factor domain-containing protein [Penicillium angulare]